jgi:hypothetical protein
MGFFTPDPKNKIQFHELDKHLKSLGFSSEEVRHIKPHFEEHKATGITKDHIKQIARELRTNYKDKISDHHVERMSEGLLGKIEEASKPISPPDTRSEGGEAPPKKERWL